MKKIALSIVLVLCTNILFAQGIAEAGKNGDINRIKDLVEQGEDINAPDAEGYTALAYAVKQDDFSLVKKLIKLDAVADASTVIAITQTSNSKMLKLFKKQGFNINAQDKDGNSPMMHALKTSNREMFLFFLGNGADATIRDKMGNSPLLYAIENDLGDDIITALIPKSDLSSMNTSGQSALSAAMSKNNSSLFRNLLSAGADVNVVGPNGLSPFWFALESGDMELTNFLMESNTDLSAERNGKTPIIYALATGNKALFNQLVAKNADVNKDGSDGMTPLMMTLKSGDAQSYSTLLAHPSVNINHANRYGYTILDEAFKFSPSSVIKDLIAKGAKFGPAQDRNNMTPLMYAIEFGKNDLIYDLMDPTTISKENYFGKTALILAIEKGDINLVTNLINSGASPSRQNYLGNCSVGYAVAYNRLDILQLLLRKGGDVNCVNKYGSTPLIEAAFYDRPTMASILIAAGANRNHRANFGDTAYDVADRLKNQAVLSVLSR